MSRLYYPKKLGDLRLASESGTNITEIGKKVAKLIPSELLTAYTGLISLTLNVRNPSWRPGLFAFAFLLCVIMTPVYLNKMADPGRPKRNHLIVSTLAFVVWAFFVSGQQVLPADWYDPAIASIALVVFSVISAAIPLDK